MEESGKERDPIHHEVAEIRTMPGDGDGEEEEDKGLLVSRDAILPDELLQKVLSFLPVANIIKLGIVCKQWYEVIHSYSLSWEMMAPQKPLFLRSCFKGRVCDPHFLRLPNFGFTRSEKTFGRTSSSCGLVCLMNTKDGSDLLVGNPIKSDWKLLPQVPGGCSSNYNALALSFDCRTRGYSVVVAKCSKLPENSRQRHFSVHIYESTTQSWATLFAQDIGFWMGRQEAVICDGMLYCVIISSAAVRYVMALDLNKPLSTFQFLIRVPNYIECVGLINLSNKLVMVGRKDSASFLRKAVVIFELEDKTWLEVARMPLNMYLSDYKFTCCGAGDFLFMHCLKWPQLLTFDMRQKVWKWSGQPPCVCPDKPVQLKSVLFRGFCFVPRLDVSS